MEYERMNKEEELVFEKWYFQSKYCLLNKIRGKISSPSMFNEVIIDGLNIRVLKEGKLYIEHNIYQIPLWETFNKEYLIVYRRDQKIRKILGE